MNKAQIIKELRLARRELKVCFDTNLIDARDRAINNCYYLLDKVIKEHNLSLSKQYKKRLVRRKSND